MPCVLKDLTIPQKGLQPQTLSALDKNPKSSIEMCYNCYNQATIIARMSRQLLQKNILEEKPSSPNKKMVPLAFRSFAGTPLYFSRLRLPFFAFFQGKKRQIGFSRQLFRSSDIIFRSFKIIFFRKPSSLGSFQTFCSS